MAKIRDDMVRFTVTIMAYTDKPDDIASRLEQSIQQVVNRVCAGAVVAPVDWRAVTKKTQILAQALADSWTKSSTNQGEQNG